MTKQQARAIPASQLATKHGVEETRVRRWQAGAVDPVLDSLILHGGADQ